MFCKCASFSIFMVVTSIFLSSVSVCEELDQKQGLRPIFDARMRLKDTKASKQEIALLKNVVAPAAGKFWKKQGKECDEPELDIIDVAHGSFTKASSTQKAVLYKYCTTGHNFALDGIAILEKNHVVAHIVYDGAWDLAIGALPDINGNGLSEIIVSTGGTSTGEIWGVIAIIEISGNSIRKFGRAATYSSNGGQEIDERKIRTEASKFWARPGNHPGFYRESFLEKSNHRKNKWVKITNSKRFDLDKDDVTYFMIAVGQ